MAKTKKPARAAGKSKTTRKAPADKEIKSPDRKEHQGGGMPRPAEPADLSAGEALRRLIDSDREARGAEKARTFADRYGAGSKFGESVYFMHAKPEPHTERPNDDLTKALKAATYALLYGAPQSLTQAVLARHGFRNSGDGPGDRLFPGADMTKHELLLAAALGASRVKIDYDTDNSVRPRYTMPRSALHLIRLASRHGTMLADMARDTATKITDPKDRSRRFYEIEAAQAITSLIVLAKQRGVDVRATLVALFAPMIEALMAAQHVDVDAAATVLFSALYSAKDKVTAATAHRTPRDQAGFAASMLGSDLSREGKDVVGAILASPLRG